MQLDWRTAEARGTLERLTLDQTDLIFSEALLCCDASDDFASGGLLLLRWRGAAAATCLVWSAATRMETSRWVREAEVALECMLRAGNNLPTGMGQRLGDFQRLTGEGRRVECAGLRLPHCSPLRAFRKRALHVVIFVTEGRVTNPGSQQVTLQSIEQHQALNGLRIMVAHPKLK